MSTKELGDLGERLACEYLVKKGYNILDKNYRISFGEIDIIARKKFKLFGKNDKVIHFVEVKTILQTIPKNGRPSILGNSNSRSEPVEGFLPEEKVDYKKQRKLRQMAEIWLGKNKFKQNYPYQIDVVGILINENIRNAKLHYFSNVVSGN